MTLKDTILEKLRSIGHAKEDTREPLGDDETRDKFLRSLRRESRTQDEEVEKEVLQKKIAEFKKDKLRRDIFGIKDDAKESKGMIQSNKISPSMINNSNFFSNRLVLKKKKPLPKNPTPSHNNSFLGKGFL